VDVYLYNLKIIAESADSGDLIHKFQV
jgi:hypothetical protein